MPISACPTPSGSHASFSLWWPFIGVGSAFYRLLDCTRKKTMNNGMDMGRPNDHMKMPGNLPEREAGAAIDLG